ncbi:hypothetical protein KY284_005663 [Solanum tuberosum]|nr:hypothetical protein KY284_005663 [Solanum tuberosum]
MGRWWSSNSSYIIQVVFQVVLIVILWCLWKRRNNILHGDSFSERKAIWEINDIILKGHRNNYSINIVRWIPPPTNWVKCNTDGASKDLGRDVGCPLECDARGQFHKLFEEIIISESDYQFSHFKDILMEGRRILNLDKSGTTHIRRRLVD